MSSFQYYIWLLKAYIEFQKENHIHLEALNILKKKKAYTLKHLRQIGKWDERFKAEILRMDILLKPIL